MHQIINQLKKSQDILVTTHVQPDGDALGSLIAMGLALSAFKKSVTLYTEGEIPNALKFLPAANRIVHHLDDVNSFDTAVILDCGDLQRVGEFAPKISKIPMIINIDHHITNTGFGHLQIVDPTACATAEIIYRLVKEMQMPISRLMAFSIYTGIMTDTGSFRFTNTNQEAFAICEEMVGLGVDPSFVAGHVSVTYSLSRIKLLNMVLESIEVSENGKLSLMTLTQEMLTKANSKPEDLGRLINYARHIENVKVAALIFESKRSGPVKPNGKHQFHISLRSDGTVNVAEIAEKYGGGGHRSAAGFNLTTTLKNIKKKILSLADTL